MNIKRVSVTIALLVCLFGLVVGVRHINARQVYPFPLQSPEQLRLQLIGNEQIAGPDGRSVVNGWSVLVFKDRKASVCYLAFKQADSISALQVSPCPQ